MRHSLAVEAGYKELEVVKLLTDVGRWPAGTVATVLRADEATALVEISDDRGHGLDVLSVPQEALVAAEGGVSRVTADTGDLLAAVDAHLATATPHAAGTTD